MIPLTSVDAEMETLVTFEEPNVAVSEGSLGIVIGVQLAAVFQSPEVGLRSHVALPALTAVADDMRRPNVITAKVNFFIGLFSKMR
jgi:hypothetical protein